MVIWKSIRPYLSGLIRFFHISYIEAKSQNRGSHLGILWVPLSSLIFSAMLALVFRHSDTMPLTDFFFYVLVGYIFWGFISDSITGSTDVIQSRFEFAVHNNLTLAGLFGKLLVDRLFEFFLNLALVVVLILVIDPGKFGTRLGLFLPFIALIVLTSVGTAYLVNLTTIFYPDMKSLFRVGTRFMFFASPVFWSAADTTGGARAFLVQYNPAAYYLSLPRQVFGIEALDLKAWLIAAILSVIVCVAAYIAYHHSQAFVRNLK
ncbi:MULTISPECIES: ABC transporter permease [Chelativorans]|jgi:lipopolysaccharide transport system permease protein|uniref:ABC-2 type transporter n=1 Tax=Chelativorans sp. (strain BNC1) TaxID=266779 RepID=Q11L31_CHESB|nr:MULTISPECIES: ABC transporter [Chelativorans]